MKTSALKNLRAKLAGDEPVLGLWVTLESTAITEMAVALGLDWVVIDAEHGQLDWKEIADHLRATVRSDTVALVRVAELDRGLIKRALDLGADGIVIPWIETAEQLARAVAFARYPPQGERGIGAERATGWGQCMREHTAEANEHVLVVPILESVAAVNAVPEMCQIDGVELFWFGPADFSSTAGYRGEWEGPGVAAQILAMKDRIRQSGRHCGVIATGDDNLRERLAQGFRAIGVGTDAGLFVRSLKGTLAAVGRDMPIRASLTPESPQPGTVGRPLPRPPETMRPDRPEQICPVGQGQPFEIAPGVRFEGLVGTQNGARHLTTGIVTLAPGAVLPYHTHPFSESVTLLEGALEAEVEGRSYQLSRLDNVVIPPGRAHQVANPSPTQPATVHVAMASDTPSRALVSERFTKTAMPDDSCGQERAERVTRFATARRGSAGPNTVFIDCFNRDLMPGIEMSGGYGLFQPGGRLPAHVHDFDESICIISGTATCVVEGRRYSMSDRATALEPRGRVHYFVNESDLPMEMLWVYAGPVPERIIVAEACATPEGNPWR